MITIFCIMLSNEVRVLNMYHCIIHSDIFYFSIIYIQLQYFTTYFNFYYS